MTRKRAYKVVYRRGSDGWWAASIDLGPGKGCNTQGKTIAQARTRIREALGLYIGDAAETAVLHDDVQLPTALAKALDRHHEARAKAEAAAQRAAESTRKAVQALADEGMSLRDAGELLGLSHARVKQIAEGGR